MIEEWSFPEPPNTGVITTRRIVSHSKPVLVVVHEAAWQFLDGMDVKEKDATVVSLGVMLQLDPSLATLATLPSGWQAWRETPASPWHREQVT